MDDVLKSKLNSYKNGLLSSRNNYENTSYLLRSASKNNVSRKQGIYSKFLSKSKSNLNSGYLTSSQQLTENSRLHSTLNNERRGNENEISSCDISRAEASGLSGFRNANEVSRTQPNETGRKCIPREENYRAVSQPRRCADSSPPRRLVNSPPQRHINTSLNRLPNSPPRRLSNAPPQRHANSPPRRLTNTPSKGEDSYDSFIPSKRADLSTRSKADGGRLYPRVLLTDFRRNGNPKNFTRDNDGVLAPARDNDGFLVPKLPMQRSKMQKFKDLVKYTKIIANNLVDAAPKANVYWVFKRIELFLEDHFRNISIKSLDGSGALPQDKNSQVASWLHSTTKNNFGGEMPLGSTASTILQDYAPSVLGSVNAPLSVHGCPPTTAKASYILNDWTIIKGKEPQEVRLSGKLIDINSHEVIEENHVSSHVIAADSLIAQTVCCVYLLTGEFQDHENSIPQDVKRYFTAGKFPKEWKDVMKLWSILRTKEEKRLADLTAAISRIPYEEERPRLEHSRIRQTLRERDFTREERTLNAERNLLNQLRDSENEKKVRELFEKFFREKEEAILCREERALRDERTLHSERGLRRDARIREDNSEIAEEEKTVNRDSHDSRLVNTSRYGRKRKANGRYENSTTGQQQKKLRIEPSRRATLNTPRNSGRLSFISHRTRSAARKQQLLDSFLCTPKSSKVRKIRSRIQTPGPNGRRRILQDDSISLDDSDHM